MKKICVVCGSSFEANRTFMKYCSHKCANHSRYSRTHEQIRRDNERLESELIKWYKAGKTDKEISEKIGRSHTWCRNTRVKLGLPTHGQKRRRQKEARKQELAQVEVRFCKKCGAFFYTSNNQNKIFCSRECQISLHHQTNDIKRKRILDMSVADIPLDEVYRKYNGICYLCGGKCDYNDYEWVNGHKNVHGNYPSREHVIPLSKGGLHTWENVRLAHIRCNSSKGVRCG